MVIIGDSIISSLGFTTLENFEAVKAGKSGLQSYQLWNLPEPFIASLIDRERLQDAFTDIKPLNKTYTPFEQAMIVSVQEANKAANIDLAAPNVLFIISTTKGNVELMDIRLSDMRLSDMRYETNSLKSQNLKSQISKSQISNLKSQIYLWYSAKLITDFFKNSNTPLVISNACISGGAAQIAAFRALQLGKYDYAVVVGADLLSKFIVSGFQSFKALSPEPCRPFDKKHQGLNLGEAAATVIMSNEQLTMNNGIRLVSGAIYNDANHISAPSKTGEGSFKALNCILDMRLSDMRYETNNPKSHNLKSQIAFINAHGTATSYNDDMEMTAIIRAGLENVPVNSLKSVFGHTLGAAGILESIISAKALQEGLVLKTLGFEENEQLTINNEQFALNICKENTATDKKYFIKMMSGFGGVNAVLLFSDMRCEIMRRETNPIFQSLISQSLKSHIPNLYITSHINLSFKNSTEITECYRSLQVNYPKFFKMDNLCKTGFLAAEKLLQHDTNKQETAIICFTSAGSLNTDKAYQKTIQNGDDFFPSPSLFVYTLPNIVTGEIAIRHGCRTETTCYVCEKIDAKMIIEIVMQTFNSTPNLQQALVSWLNDDEHCEAKMMLVKKEGNIVFSEENIKNIIYN